MNLPAQPHRSVLDLPLRKKIAQLLLVRIGSNLPPIRTVEQDENRISQLLDQCPVGGLLLFNGGPQTKEVLARLQKRSATPLLVASDIERGVGQQVEGYTLFPHAMAFGKMEAADGDVAIRRFAQVLTHEAREVGIHITLAPVADVSSNPKNPIIVTRAFSEDPERAAELVARFVDLVQANGLLATAKHFPGHGDTARDSHDSLPNVRRSMAELTACELMPFQAAINAGCQLIMTAHVSYPALDASEKPATVSPAILTKLLRGEMGFRGVVCSDSLLMAGVRDQFASEGEMAAAALLAGVDLLLDVNDPCAVVDHLCECVEEETLSIARIDEAARRIADLKATAHKSSWPVFSRESAELVARHAVQIVGEENRRLLPLSADTSLGVILLKPFETSRDPPEQPLAAALRERFRDVKFAQLGPNSTPADYTAAENLVCGVSQLLVAVIVRPAAWHTFGLLPAQTEFAHELLKQHPSNIVASLGVSAVLEDFPEAGLWICTFSDVPVSQQALAEFLVR